MAKVEDIPRRGAIFNVALRHRVSRISRRGAAAEGIDPRRLAGKAARDVTGRIRPDEQPADGFDAGDGNIDFSGTGGRAPVLPERAFARGSGARARNSAWNNQNKCPARAGKITTQVIPG